MDEDDAVSQVVIRGWSGSGVFVRLCAETLRVLAVCGADGGREAVVDVDGGRESHRVRSEAVLDCRVPVVSVSRGRRVTDVLREERGVLTRESREVVTDELVKVAWERNAGRQRCVVRGREVLVGRVLRILRRAIAPVARMVLKEVRCLVSSVVKLVSKMIGRSGFSVWSIVGL